MGGWYTALVMGHLIGTIYNSRYSSHSYFARAVDPNRNPKVFFGLTNSLVSIHCVARGLCNASFLYRCRRSHGGSLRQHGLLVLFITSYVFNVSSFHYSNVFGRPFVKNVSPHAIRPLSVCPICDVDVSLLWPNGWMDQYETWHAGRPRLWPHCITLGPSSPSPKATELPQFSAHICCDQMARWIKMPLGREVSFGPSDIVLDRDPALCPQKGAEPPNCRPMSIVAKRLDASIWHRHAGGHGFIYRPHSKLC